MSWDKAALQHFIEEGIPFNRFLGMKMGEFGDGTASLLLPFRPELVGDPKRPALHGGVLSTLLDTVGGLAAFAAIQKTQRVSTLDIRVDYLLPGPLEDLIATAAVVRKGNRVVLVEAQVRAASSASTPVVATARAVYNIFDPRD